MPSFRFIFASSLIGSASASLRIFNPSWDKNIVSSAEQQSGTELGVGVQRDALRKADDETKGRPNSPAPPPDQTTGPDTGYHLFGTNPALRLSSEDTDYDAPCDNGSVTRGAQNFYDPHFRKSSPPRKSRLRRLLRVFTCGHGN